MLSAIDREIEEIMPKVVLVYGDTNSTLAAALSITKRNIPLVHIEAGLRSFNRNMPEEKNRVLVDHISDILFAPTVNAMENLKKEGLESRSELVGDVMADLLRTELRKILQNNPKPGTRLKPYLLCTIHRAENTDSQDRLRQILSAIGELNIDVRLPIHPRLREKLKEFNLKLPPNLSTVLSLSHSEMISTMLESSGVITDSGGLQKEAFLLQVPCTTIRNETEWIETLEDNWNILVDDLQKLSIYVHRPVPLSQKPMFGSGDASQKIVKIIQGKFDLTSR
jgi:UDP-N-acetylglucosamine 2-epimerase (non-hydrolysing)